MNSDVARRSHDILMRALDLAGAERQEFIAAQCAEDPLLRSYVDKLLSAVTKSRVFLEAPAIKTRAEKAGSTSRSHPEQIGGYRIMRVLGAGGMATVYEAEQQQPRRPVALKIMRRALLHTTGHQRFRFETEVLARLRHPGIAQIYEAGTFEDSPGVSLPYFAMEFVPGASTITAHAKAIGLPLRDRLRMFLDVCDAVQHGHQLGVIHRDLKPANILVTSEAPPPPADESAPANTTTALPKIIDFGIARPVDSSQAGITQDSDTGRIIGTLSAMSPEQCAGEGVDVRTDVYALGNILFELIADRPPHDFSRSSVPEAIRIITHDAPPALGTLVPHARGDLDAIVSKAIEKEPPRRYAGVDALAADIRRYLADQPIEARPATTYYQLRKFARRNRGLVLSIATVFFTLLAGVAATSYSALLAQRARQAAEQRGRELTQVVAFQQSQLREIDPWRMGQQMRESLVDAVASARDAGKAAPPHDIEQLLNGVNFSTVAVRLLDESILARSLDSIRTQFANQPLIRAGLLQRLAQTRMALGLSQGAAAVAEEALQIRRSHLGIDHVDSMESQYLLGTAQSALGRSAEAIGTLRDLLDRSTAARGTDSVEALLAAGALGGALRRAGDLDGAEKIWRSTLEIQRRVLGDNSASTLGTINNLGIIHATRGQLAEAETCWRDVLERRRRAGPQQGPAGAERVNLGMILQDQGRFGEALPLLEAELASNRERQGDQHPETLDAMLNLAALWLQLGDFSAAERLQRECLAGWRMRMGAAHRKTLRAMAALAEICNAAGKLEEAEQLVCSALDHQCRDLRSNASDTIEFLLTLSGVLRNQHRFEEAETRSSEALTIARREFADVHPLMIDCLLTYGKSLAALERWEEALFAFDEAFELAIGHLSPSHIKMDSIAEALESLRESKAENHDNAF